MAQLRFDNAMALFEAFVRDTAQHADAATLRGLERRFAEHVDIQPSYWSQIKGRTRQIGERLARQFEQRCDKPRGWLDLPHRTSTTSSTSKGTAGQANATAASETASHAVSSHAGLSAPAGTAEEWQPRDDDERFILGLVMTYYRRHPQRARTRLLDLLGEVLVPSTTAASRPSPATATTRRPEDPQRMWEQSRAGVAPLKRKR